MKRLLAYTTACALVVAAGCEGGESRIIATTSTNPDRVVIPLLADISGATVRDTTPMILSSIDGEVQEEVIYTDGPLAPIEEAEVLEIPEIIASALSEAPQLDEAFVERQVILKNEDGTIQEEVVFIESDDEVGSAGEVEEVQTGEVNIATLQVPSPR